jgi:hypothetical protein
MRIFGTLLALVGCLSVVGSARAFDTGHHYDLTREALSEHRMSEHAIQIAQVENWLVDYYSNQPAAGMEADLARLHFDNLTTTGQVRNYWGNLTVNTKRAVEKAARDDDAMQVLALIGMSLHAVQDFYTHSNWVETHSTFSDAYSTRTWFDVPPPLTATALVTGAYPNQKPVLRTDHGNYAAGMNHDSYVRPRWDEAYVYAYSASVQWVAAIERWVSAIDPRVWNDARRMSLDSTRDITALRKDRAAAYKISEWVATPGNDGHWKGNGSGSGAEWGKYVAGWAGGADSRFVNHFKSRQWHKLLTEGLTGATPPDVPVPSVPARLLSKRAVRVRTTMVEELPVDFFEARMDVAGRPDFVAQVTIEGQTFVEAMQIDKSSITPSWWSIKFVDRGLEKASISYELFDEDSTNEVCDVNPTGGKQKLDFSLSLFGGSVSGDLSGTAGKRLGSEGTKPDKNRARIILIVDSRDLRS